MHPAYSVILFTTASGAGYGLLALLSLSARWWVPTMPLSFFVAGFGLAFGLIALGLIASTGHLGRPERAWRAFSQWRTSWLSREGILALAALVPAALLAWRILSREGSDLGVRSLLTGAVAAGLAMATLWCTGMIYASLPTVPAWKQPLVAPLYCLLGVATGAVLLALLAAAFRGAIPAKLVWCALAALSAAWLAKARYWDTIDAAPRAYTISTATGLGGAGSTVRPLDPPHTQANFVMREMGYAVARTHARRLRQWVCIALFLVPSVCLALTMAAGAGPALMLTLTATLSAAAGVAMERWLFFAEAEHVSMLYYGKPGV
jgi:sulfite dehydrogenase (quinone) subunit SoeC